MTLYLGNQKVCPTITINQGGGGDSGGEYLIKVIDYDGTILKQDHLDTGATFELPEPPTTHERLLFQTWSSPLPISNNTITVGKSDVTIGAIYTTKSGLNEFVIELNVLTGLSFNIFGSSLGGDDYIDWGDGTVDKNYSHTYADYGIYTIKTNSVWVNVFELPIVYAHCSQAGWFYNLLNKTFKGVTFANTLFGDEFVDMNFAVGQYTVPALIYPPIATSIANTRRAVVSFNVCKDIVFPYGLRNFETEDFKAIAILGQYSDNVEVLTFPATVEELPPICSYTTEGYCYNTALREVNFTEHTFVPSIEAITTTLQGDVFRNKYCKIRVPKALEDEWKSATNWTVYADYIVGV